MFTKCFRAILFANLIYAKLLFVFIYCIFIFSLFASLCKNTLLQCNIFRACLKNHYSVLSEHMTMTICNVVRYGGCIQKLKVACMVCIVIKQVLSIIRCAIILSSPHDSVYLYFFLPVLIVGVIFSGLQMYSLLRELQQDFFWFRSCFSGIYNMYISIFIFHLYPQIAILIFGYERSIRYTGGYFFDTTESIMNLAIQALILYILCCPLCPRLFCHPNTQFSHGMNTDVSNTYHVTPDQQTAQNIAMADNLQTLSPVDLNPAHLQNQNNIYQTAEEDDVALCMKHLACVFGVVFYFIYVGAFFSLIYYMIHGN